MDSPVRSRHARPQLAGREFEPAAMLASEPGLVLTKDEVSLLD